MSVILVPVTVKALMVGEPYAKDRYADLSDDYSRLDFDEMGEYVRGSLVTRSDMQKGVHLHWSLPDALTAGKQDDEKAETLYPCIPNRWQITRAWAEGGKIKTSHWIVESDYKSEKRKQSGSPAWPVDNDKFAYIGRSYPTDKKPAGTADYLKSFNIASSGNPINTAFYPSCRNVLGFCDDLIYNGKRLENTVLTYSVCGWYENEAHDILHGCEKTEQLRERLDGLGWRISEKDGENLAVPFKTVCHGMICNIPWKNDKTQYLSTDNVVTPDVAVANTSPEALAAVLANYNTEFSKDKPIEYSGQIDERMLLHLLCGTQLDITDLDGLIHSENRIHESFFTNSSAERRFELKALTDNPDVELYGILNKMLADLNLTEKEIFFLETEIRHYGELLFDALFISIKCGEKQTGIESLAAKLEELRGSLDKKRSLSREYVNKIGQYKDFELNMQNGERFWEPNNPALLLSNISADLSHGGDGRFEAEETMLLRTGTLKSLNVGNETEFVAEADGLETARYQELIKESILLSPSFAEIICGKSPENAAIIRSLQCAPYATAQTEERTLEEIGEELLFGGTPPSKIAVSYYLETWYPLYLEWQLIFFPDKEAIKKAPSLKSWRISSGYDLTCTNAETFSETGLSMSGRTFLTSYTAKFLAEKLAENDLTVPGSAWIEVLSQVLGNFNSQLLMHDLKLTPDLNKIIEKFQKKFSYNAAKIRNLLDGFMPQYPVFDTHFSPVRAGFMSIERVSVIDSFGRLKQYRPDDCYTAEAMRFPLEKKPNHVLLPPRIVQPSRISFKWEESLVAAWLMPNFFESSMGVFDAAGELICQLYSTFDGTVVRLSPLYGGKRCKDLKQIIKDADLLGFLEELIKGERLKSLLQYTNDAFDRINTPQSSATSAFAAGRPLVLARARIALELRNPPMKYKRMTGVNRDIDVESLAVPVKIGQPANNHDGVIGVFTDKEYGGMLLSSKLSGDITYFKGGGTFEIYPRWNAPKWRELTVLMDPYAELNIISGLLPIKTMKLPESLVAERTEKMSHLFFVAPLICGNTEISLPLPLVEKMRWSWLENEGENINEQYAARTNEEAAFDNSVRCAREGWLKLTAEKET